MKRLWSRFGARKRTSALWLCNALGVLIFTLSPLFVFAPASARPAMPSPGNGGGTVPGGGTITATFLDANHIGIVASGNITFSYHDTQGNSYTTTSSLFPIQGVYYAQISSYPDWGGGYQGILPENNGTGAVYWFDNNNANPGGSVCAGHNSDLIIQSFDAGTGTATGKLEMRIPVVNNKNSTDQTPTCQPIGNYPDQNGYDVTIPILNVSSGFGTTNSFSVSAATVNGNGGARTGGGSTTAVSYNGLRLPDAASSAYYYENDASTIYASPYDPSIGAKGGANGWDSMYQFTNPTTNADNSKTYHQQVAGYVDQHCPDAITIPKGAAGNFIKATYSTWVDKSGVGCGSTNPTKPVATYPIIILTRTPEAYLSSLTGQASTTGTGGGTQGGAANSLLPDCTSGGGGVFSFLSPTKVLNWILCGAINQAMWASTFMDSWIMQQLNVHVQDIFDTSSGSKNAQNYYTAWDAFRVLATALLIIAGLIMIAAEAFGVELLDAYTIRKVLPRLIIAIIGISLSWPIMEFIVGFFDTLGSDIGNIMFSPFTSLGLSFGPSSATGIGTLVGVGGAILLLGPATLTFLLTALLAALVGFIVLTIRQIGVVMLVILSPVAIACYILPGTQKVWKVFYDNFLGLMLMFPIVEIIIAGGHIFAVISFNASKNAATGAQLIDQAIGLICWFGVYFIIPMAARMSTGAIGTIGGFVNDRHRGAFDRLKNVRQNAMSTNAKKTGNYSRFSDDSMPGRVANTLLGAGSHPVRDLRRGLSGVRQGRQAGRAMMGAETLKNDAVYNANAHDDAFLYALAAGEAKTQAKADKLRRKAASQTEAERKVTLANAAMLEQGIATARGVKDHGSAGVRLGALDALTRTGYQIDDGDDGGYEELSGIVGDITRGDAGAYSRTMNNSQYNMGTAGRFDMAGVNNGTGYDAKLGLDKADPYTLGRAKKQTVRTMGRAIQNHVKEGDAAAKAGRHDEAHEHYRRASQYKQELVSIAQNGKGDIRDAALEAHAEASKLNTLTSWEGRDNNARNAGARVMPRDEDSRRADDTGGSGTPGPSGSS